MQERLRHRDQNKHEMVREQFMLDKQTFLEK